MYHLFLQFILESDMLQLRMLVRPLVIFNIPFVVLFTVLEQGGHNLMLLTYLLRSQSNLD